MSKSTIIENPIINYKWIWDKNKNPLDFGFRKLTASENEYTKTYSLWKHHGHTTIYAVFTVNEDNQINIDVCEENGNTYGLFYHSINEPIVQELLNKLLKILKTLNAHTVTSKGEKKMSNTNTVATKNEKDIKEIVIVKRWLCNKLIENGFNIKYVKADRDNPQRTVFVFDYSKKLASVKDGLILEHLDEVDKAKKKDMQVVTMSVDDVENVVRKVVKEEIQK